MKTGSDLNCLAAFPSCAPVPMCPCVPVLSRGCDTGPNGHPAHISPHLRAKAHWSQEISLKGRPASAVNAFRGNVSHRARWAQTPGPKARLLPVSHRNPLPMCAHTPGTGSLPLSNPPCPQELFGFHTFPGEGVHLHGSKHKRQHNARSEEGQATLTSARPAPHLPREHGNSCSGLLPALCTQTS